MAPLQEYLIVSASVYALNFQRNNFFLLLIDILMHSFLLFPYFFLPMTQPKAPDTESWRTLPAPEVTADLVVWEEDGGGGQGRGRGGEGPGTGRSPIAPLFITVYHHPLSQSSRNGALCSAWSPGSFPMARENMHKALKSLDLSWNPRSLTPLSVSQSCDSLGFFF